MVLVYLHRFPSSPGASGALGFSKGVGCSDLMGSMELVSEHRPGLVDLPGQLVGLTTTVVVIVPQWQQKT